MPIQDNELLIISRCKRLLEQCKSPMARARVLSYLTSISTEMTTTGLIVELNDPRQTTIPGTDATVPTESSPFDAE